MLLQYGAQPYYKEMTDEENENWYQQTAGFLPVDGEVLLEEIDLAVIPEIPKVDPFASLYQMDSDTEDADTDDESDAGVEAQEEPEGLKKSRP
jgi:hypothetical protein